MDVNTASEWGARGAKGGGFGHIRLVERHIWREEAFLRYGEFVCEFAEVRAEGADLAVWLVEEA
jgi:hypothetical protein